MHSLLLLKALWTHSKALAASACAFIIAQIFFAYKQIDSTPFYNYGMYSAKAQLYKEYNTFLIHIDGKPLNPNSLPALAKDFLFNNLHFYAEIKKYGDKVEATLRQTANRRFAFLSQNARSYCIQQLTNNPQPNEIAMRAWLLRFLSQYHPQPNDIHVYELLLTPQGPSFAALDTFKLL